MKQTYTFALQEVTVSIICFTVQQFGISTNRENFQVQFGSQTKLQFLPHGGNTQD